MKKVTVAVVLIMAFLAVAASAQSSQPMSNQSMSNQPAQGQAPEASMSPDAQARIMKAINHNLIMLPYYGVFDNLVYLLQGRTVILTGQVTNPSLKPDAERAVKKVEGIDKVINNIEILPPAPWTSRFASGCGRSFTAAMGRFSSTAAIRIRPSASS